MAGMRLNYAECAHFQVKLFCDEIKRYLFHPFCKLEKKKWAIKMVSRLIEG
jgi:hypothetical protein